MLKKISEGAFSGVFDYGDGTIVKVFRNGMDCGIPASSAGEVSFEAEVQAYEALQSHQDLERFVPQYYGAVSLTPDQVDNPSEYLLDHAIRLEKLEGEESKVGSLFEPLRTRADQILEDIKDRIGVDDPWDASCFVPGSRADFTLIDFSTPTEKL